MLLAILLVSSCTGITNTTNKQHDKASPVVVNDNGEQLQGFLSDLKINANSFTVGQPIIVSGNFNAQSDGNYYIEFGLDKSSKQSLTVLKSSQSACDQSINYAGVWANNAKANDIIPFQLTIKDYGETGKYNVVGGVYSRCGVGSDISSATPIPIIITASRPAITAPPATTSNVNPPSVSVPVTQCTPSGYFTELWFRKFGYSSSADNSVPRVVGRFKSTSPCQVTYYIEAGMLQSSFKPLNVVASVPSPRLQGIPSACDMNIHFSGVKAILNQGEIANFELYPNNFGVDGRYDLQGGVFYNNGKFCGNADIASFSNEQVVFAGFSQSNVENSWIRII